jgi:hypothetical protein
MSEILIPGAPNALPAGYATQSLSGGLPSLQLPDHVAAADIIEFTGTLTMQNIVVTVPKPLFPQQVASSTSFSSPTATGWMKIFKNSATGGFTVTVIGPNGTGVVVPQGLAGWLYSKDGVNVQVGSAGSSGSSMLVQFPNRLDLSVNHANVDNAQSNSPVLTTRTGSNAVGAFNGGGTGNKALLCIRGFDKLPLSQLTTLEFTWNDIFNDLTLGLLPYINLVVEADPVAMPGVYHIFVITAALVPTSINSFTVTSLGGGRFNYRYVAATNTIQVVWPGAVGFPPVVPVVNNGPAWFDQAFRMSDILAAYPNARLRDASSLDGGLPKATVTPSLIFVIGDSNNLIMNSKLIEQILFNGVMV